MPVRCPRCGREYEPARFSLGRTLDCACGERVAMEAPTAPLGAEGEPRFVADAMLGRLAHWLRLLGFDTVWSGEISEDEIARRAFEEERIALTRSRSLARRRRLPRLLVLESETLRDQLGALERELALAGKQRPFTRCSRCNELLEAAPPESVAAQVPPRVRGEQTRFARCPSCGRIYWEGSHVARVRRWLEEVRAGAARGAMS